MAYELQAPPVLGTEFLMEAGRDLMAWWNEQGPELPEPGERYRRWWYVVHRELDDAGMFGPGLARGPDILQRLQAYAEEARRWWNTGESETPPPPVFLDADPIIDAEPIRASASALWAAAVLAGVLAVFYFGRR